MPDISAPIARMVAATNAEDRAAFDNIGVHARFEATAERADGDGGLVVTLVVTGGGFNGTSDIEFGLEGDRIARMIISADD